MTCGKNGVVVGHDGCCSTRLGLTSDVDLERLVDQIRAALAVAEKPPEQGHAKVTNVVHILAGCRRTRSVQQVAEQTCDHIVFAGKTGDGT